MASTEVTGWRSRNLVLGLKLSSFWLKAFVPAGELKDTAMDATCKRIGTLPQDCTTLDCSFPVFSLPALISGCLNLPDGTQENSEKVREAEGSLYPTNILGTQKRLVWGSLDPQRVLLSFIQRTGRRRIWPPSAKTRHSSAPIWRIDTELEISLNSKTGM